MRQLLTILCVYLSCCCVSAEDVDFTTTSPIGNDEGITVSLTFSSDLDYNSDDAEELSLVDQEGTFTTELPEEQEDQVTTTPESATFTPEAAPASSTQRSTTTLGPVRTPKMIIEPSMIQLFTVGEPLVLECFAQSEFDQGIKYSWSKNGRPFSINGQDVFSESGTNGNILFVSPKMADVGTYQCEAENSFGKVFSRASLLRAKQARNQPRRLTLSEPISAQVLVDPNAEDKDLIERIPITEALPEIFPSNLVEPVFVVFPRTSDDDEPAEILDMELVNNADAQ